ncbi:MAG: DUF3800 domain-containing protein [Butyrivibrio sp.]|nr:DUF3800 domain-containing protein [Butyrivibrio sp.]
MEYLYMDESGSMTVSHNETHPYFIISIIRAKNIDKLKRVYKRFVSSYREELKKADKRNLMFKDSSFLELKGSCFTPKLKREFVDFFCKNEYFELFYIVAENSRIQAKFYENTARAFNYLVRLALEYYIQHNYITDDGLILQLDERNEKTETKHFLENYLQTELGMRNLVNGDCKVNYYDSANNCIIQIADVFSNLYFSELKTNAYTKEIERMKKDGYLKHIFEFPL